MFKFLKKIMNNEKSMTANDINSIHRILKSDIKKEPNFQEDEIVLDVDVSGGLKNVFGNFLE